MGLTSKIVVGLILLSPALARAQVAPQESAASYIKRGTSWFEAGDFERALTDFDMAIAFDPKAAKAFYNRGRVSKRWAM